MSRPDRREVAEELAPELVILSGEPGSGKTGLCCEAMRLARRRGLSVGGVVTLSHEANGIATKLVHNVRTGEERPLARFVDVTGDPLIEHWQFTDEAIAWGEQALCSAVPCDVLIVDELGPLELVYGRGWHAAIGVLQARRCRIALASVRPLLLTDLTGRLASMVPEVLDVKPGTYQGLLARIERWIEAIHDSR
jgi:nucleoside-triphosphatase THEP1